MGPPSAHDTSWKRVIGDSCDFWIIYRLARHVANNDFAMARERPFMDPTRNKTAQWSRVCSVKRPSAGSHAVRSDRSCCILYQPLLSSPLTLVGLLRSLESWLIHILTALLSADIAQVLIGALVGESQAIITPLSGGVVSLPALINALLVRLGRIVRVHDSRCDHLWSPMSVERWPRSVMNGHRWSYVVKSDQNRLGLVHRDHP